VRGEKDGRGGWEGIVGRRGVRKVRKTRGGGELGGKGVCREGERPGRGR